MRSRLRQQDYRKVYALLDECAPLGEQDCGHLCDRACCRQAGEELGIYLLPGEERMFSGQEDWLVWQSQEVSDYDFPPSWTGRTHFVRCTRPCPRPRRPIQCRSFPLAPHLSPGGELTLIWETLSLPYRCPLITEKYSLAPGFQENLYRAWHLLLADPLIRDLVEWDSRQREEQGLCTKPVYPPRPGPAGLSAVRPTRSGGRR